MKYVYIKTEGSFCPMCDKRAMLLCTTDITKNPAFYICFDCEYIGQVGVGRVEEFKDKAESQNVIKITITEYLLERALIGINWNKSLVANLITGFNSGGAERFAQNCKERGLFEDTYFAEFMTDLRMLGCGMLADAVEKQKKALQ